MAYNVIGGFPPQQLSYSRKNKTWRKACVDFADDHSILRNHATRKSVYNMDINYDLLNGKLHMDDLKVIVNPYHLDASFIPDAIQHYPVMNSKLRVLQGEESRRIFDFRVVVTNPNAISEVEEEKNNQVNQMLQQLVANTSQTEEEYGKELEKLSDYFTYEYQDKREQRANYLINHYIKEQDIPSKFNDGFKDAYTVSEEIYQCDIVGGEPYVEKLDPRDVRIIRSGSSNVVEDADMIIIEQYWNPGRVIDTYYDQLSKKDVEKIETGSWTNESTYDSMGNIDARYYNVVPHITQTTAGDVVLNPHDLFTEDKYSSGLPYDLYGNIRVLRVYWKSRRKIKKVKSYDPETGEEQFDFYPENYICDPMKGEEEQSFWVNEAWEGTKIGEDTYVNMRPRPIQYNRLSNPSRCHFGIIGSIYTSNGDQPYSMVDIMKPYAYLYDIYNDRLNKLLAKNVGKIIKLDFAKVPKGWDVEKWMYYLTVNGIAVEDSFKEGTIGASTGKLAAGLNNASSGVIDASLGNEIQQYVTVLEWLSTKIGELAGITKQREGQVSNRETVGGVERATLQSSHSTEWLFVTHDSVKKRVLECLLETAKICLKGRKKKFEYILPDGSRQLIEIDGDEFAECDYGLAVDNSTGAQELNQKLDMLAQAGLQNGMSFSTIMKLYTETSLASKQRYIEADERKKLEQQQQQQQQEMQMQQQQLQVQQQIAQQQQELQYQMHKEDNETKILVAQINASAEWDRYAMIQEENGITKQQEIEFKNKQLELDSKQFDAKLKLDQQKHKDDIAIKEKQLKVKKNTNK